MKICALCGSDFKKRFAVGFDKSGQVCDYDHRVCRTCAHKIMEYAENEPLVRNGNAEDGCHRPDYSPYCPHPGCNRQLLGFKYIRTDAMEGKENCENPGKISPKSRELIDSQGKCWKCKGEILGDFAVPANFDLVKCSEEHKFCLECLKEVVRENFLEHPSESLVCLACNQPFDCIVLGEQEKVIKFGYADLQGTEVFFYAEDDGEI